jgi:hypothetical protein
MNKKYRVCFLIQSKQHYLKLLDIAKILESEFNILFLIERRHFEFKKTMIVPCYEYKYLELYSHKLEKTVHLEAKRRKFAPISKNGLKILRGLFFLLKFIKDMFCIVFYKKIINAMDSFLSNNKVDCLILAEANVEYLSEIFIKQAKYYNIPSIIIPYTFCLPSEPARYYYDDLFRTCSWYHRFFISSKWIYEHAGHKMLRMYIYDIIFMERLRIAPPQPWIQESSTADALVIESAKMEKHYLSCKLDKSQFRVIGDEIHDKLFAMVSNKQALSRKIIAGLGFKKVADGIITFAIFPDFMYKYKTCTGFNNYEDLLQFVCNQLLRLGDYNIILCLHPTLEKEKFKFLENDKVKISDRKTVELVVISDLYVASISATIRWAIALGVPVINYDCYQMRYNDYKNVGGVVNIETKKEFIEVIDRLKEDNNYLEFLKEKQKLEMKEYGILDGKFGERLKDLIKTLIQKYKR